MTSAEEEGFMAPSPVEVTPRTSRPQPPPEPEVTVVDPLAGAPVDMGSVEARLMTARARLMNPTAPPEQIEAVVRRAMAYLR